MARPKRQAKPAADEGFWDCSVCTFRNSAEAFKCSICDVRKGTSTRKPRINSQLVAQQVAQQYATPPPPKKEKKERPERPEKERVDEECPDSVPPDSVQPDAEHQEKEKSEPEPLVNEKKEREKEISPAVTKKPSSKKTRPKSDSHQSPPSIKSGKSTTKTNNSHISRYFQASLCVLFTLFTHWFLHNLTTHILSALTPNSILYMPTIFTHPHNLLTPHISSHILFYTLILHTLLCPLTHTFYSLHTHCTHRFTHSLSTLTPLLPRKYILYTHSTHTTLTSHTHVLFFTHFHLFLISSQSLTHCFLT
uniref:RanBP2-type domain-containing protein n=1 Tax=Denticeps clupeoides TaxID=299321 RepID=A0AAY4DF91_9TELE